ncbi:MAG: hypothetical protein ACK5HL_01350 [Bacilli bacterium]
MKIKDIDIFEGKFFDQNDKGNFYFDIMNGVLGYSHTINNYRSNVILIELSERYDSQFICENGIIVSNPNYTNTKPFKKTLR